MTDDDPGVALAGRPRHIAIIMDGNGRWAQERGLSRIEGHRTGAEAVRRLLHDVRDLGIEVLTLYSFSLENWKRPREEVDALMRLLLERLEQDLPELVEHGIRLRHIGVRDGLPGPVLAAIDHAIEATRHGTGPVLAIALNYGSRREIVDAARSLAESVRAGELDPGEIDEASLGDRLSTAGLPDPDLLIRTAGEHRLSNFLLWQLSYTEIHVTARLWPDFSRDDLLEAIRDYAGRSRRLGGVLVPDADPSNSHAPSDSG